MSVTRVQLVGNVSTGASFVGVVTATSFSGSGANLTGIAATDNVRTNSLVVSGVSTLGTVVVGGATTQLIVTGNARVTGILTIGTGSITLNGTSNIINVGTGLTLGSSGINVTGVITATSFVGSGANLTGIANTANIRSDTITVGVLTATRLDVPPIPITFSPGIGATDVAFGSNIVITFSQPMQKGTGNITLRENSAGGTAFSTIGVSSSSVTISGSAVTIDPPANIGFASTTFVVVDAGALSGITITSVNALIDTYNFTGREPEPGDSYEGGFLICKASPLRWVVSPYSAEVSRSWYLRDDANTRAQQVSGCTGWFVPTRPQLQNPGYCCRSFWGPSPCYSSYYYWSSTESNATRACNVFFGSGTAYICAKTDTNCVRAFRCVTY